MLDPTEERLKASSMCFSSSVLTLRASLCIYLLGLSGLRTRSRGIIGRAPIFGSGLTDGDSHTVIGLRDRNEDPAESGLYAEYLCELGVYCAVALSDV